MARLSTVGAAVAVPGLAVAVLLSSGIANARPPDVVGQKYSEAASTLAEAGLTPIVTATVGARLPRDECIVTSITDHKMLRPAGDENFFEFGWGEVMLSLNCNGAYAAADRPGSSMGSPEGRKAADYEAEIKWRSENPSWCVEAMRDHPEWGEMEGCTYH